MPWATGSEESRSTPGPRVTRSAGPERPPATSSRATAGTRSTSRSRDAGQRGRGRLPRRRTPTAMSRWAMWLPGWPSSAGRAETWSAVSAAGSGDVISANPASASNLRPGHRGQPGRGDYIGTDATGTVPLRNGSTASRSSPGPATTRSAGRRPPRDVISGNGWARGHRARRDHRQRRRGGLSSA